MKGFGYNSPYLMSNCFFYEGGAQSEYDSMPNILSSDNFIDVEVVFLKFGNKFLTCFKIDALQIWKNDLTRI